MARAGGGDPAVLVAAGARIVVTDAALPDGGYTFHSDEAMVTPITADAPAETPNDVAREVLAGRPCTFTGEHYTVDLPVLGPQPATPPPLVLSVGSPWTMRNITPLADRVELKMGRSTRGGGLDLAALGSVTADEVRSMVDTVKSAKPDVQVSVLVFVGCGPDADAFRSTLGDGLYGTWVGEPATVAENLRALADIGIDRVNISQWLPGSISAVAPYLAG